MVVPQLVAPVPPKVPLDNDIISNVQKASKATLTASVTFIAIVIAVLGFSQQKGYVTLINWPLGLGILTGALAAGISLRVLMITAKGQLTTDYRETINQYLLLQELLFDITLIFQLIIIYILAK